MAENKTTILVVDDEATVREFLRRILENAGYAVITAADGLEALDTLSKTNVSLMLLDIKMPKLDGFQVLELIPQDLNIPVIMVSGMKEESARITTLCLGADDYVEKPFAVGELLARIQTKLRRAKSNSSAEMS